MLLIVAGVLAAVCAAGGADVEMQLEAAIHREIVLGDLRGALDQYRAILALRDRSNPEAGRALLGMGRCFEKLGRRNEARAAYERIVNEFAGQPDLVGQARTQLAGWENPLPGPRNLQFEQGVAGKVPPGWFVPALPKDADLLAQFRRAGCRTGAGCAVLLVPANTPTPYSNLMQSFSAATYAGKTVRLRAWIRVEASDPDDRAQMWLSVDRRNRQRGFFDNMADRPVRSAEWTQCEIVGPVDRDATFIDFGITSIGRGRVWVDNVSFEAIKP